MAVFAAAGGAIFAFFGITVPAFQIAGGVIFAAISVRTLQNGEKETPGGESVDPSIVPRGIPSSRGPARSRRSIGLIAAVIGIQFVINGVTTVFVSILKAARS